MAMSTNKQKMLAGELYYANTPELNAARARCRDACMRYNNATGPLTRRDRVKLLRDVLLDETPLPPVAATAEEDEKLFEDEPYVLAPVNMDYGFNVRFGKNVFVNFNSVFLDTCLTTIGSGTLVGPNVSFFAATHPLDPVVRNGLKGPEMGKEIHVGEDCWIGGNVSILPGVTIGRGSVVGAGSVVTKDVPPFTVVAGNPARVIRKIETKMDPSQSGEEWKGWPEDQADRKDELAGEDQVAGAEVPMAEMAAKEEARMRDCEQD